MSQALEKRWIILLLLALIVIAGGYLRWHASLHTEVNVPLRADAGEYFSYAYNLHQYGVYARTSFRDSQTAPPQPDAVRSPGYPLFLLLLSDTSPTPGTLRWICLIQAVLGTLLIPLVFVMGRPLLPGAWALLPPLLVALSPQLVIIGTYILSESLFSFLLLMSLFCLQKMLEHPEHPGFALLSGLLLAAASLTRPSLQYFLPLLWLGLLPFFSPGRAWRHAFALTLGFFALYAIWLVRNLVVLGTASDSTLMLNGLLHGHYPDFMFNGRPESYGFPYHFDPRAGEIAASLGSMLREILQHFWSEPGKYLTWYLLSKPVAFFSWGDAQTASRDIFIYPVLSSPYLSNPLFALSKAMMQLSHWVWVGLALLAIAATGTGRWQSGLSQPLRLQLRLLALGVIYFLLLHSIAFPLARYCIPLLPVLFILATYSLSRLHVQWRQFMGTQY